MSPQSNLALQLKKSKKLKFVSIISIRSTYFKDGILLRSYKSLMEGHIFSRTGNYSIFSIICLIYSLHLPFNILR